MSFLTFFVPNANAVLQNIPHTREGNLELLKKLKAERDARVSQLLS